MSTPAVSIAIPLYNKAPFIADTVRTALAQSFADHEIVVVDDGSTDGGADTLRQFDDPRLKIIRQPNAGVATARTRALREGQGRYVAFLDADDLWHPDHLHHLMAMADRFPQAELLGNDYAAGSAHDGWPATPGGPVQYRLADYFGECAYGRAPLYTSSCMVLRSRALALGGFPIGNYCGEDLALWIMLAAEAPVAVSNFIGCHYRRGIDSLSRQSSYRNAPDVSMATLRDLLQRHGDWPEERKRAVREYYFRLALAHGLDCLRAGEIGEAGRFLELAADTQSQRRRLWQARALAALPAPLRGMTFRLLARA